MNFSVRHWRRCRTGGFNKFKLGEGVLSRGDFRVVQGQLRGAAGDFAAQAATLL